MRMRSNCFCVGNFTLVAKPNFFNPQIKYHVMSTCHHSNPCLTLNSNAWWLLCHPSPNAKIPTDKLFLDKSPVLYVCLPQQWATEFTAQVMWYTQTVLTQKP